MVACQIFINQSFHSGTLRKTSFPSLNTFLGTLAQFTVIDLISGGTIRCFNPGPLSQSFGPSKGYNPDGLFCQYLRGPPRSQYLFRKRPALLLEGFREADVANVDPRGGNEVPWKSFKIL